MRKLLEFGWCLCFELLFVWAFGRLYQYGKEGATVIDVLLIVPSYYIGLLRHQLRQWLLHVLCEFWESRNYKRKGCV
jgi:hypothetical protein